MIILKILFYYIWTISIGLASVLFIFQIKGLIHDISIYRNGTKYKSKCIGKVRRTSNIKRFILCVHLHFDSGLRYHLLLDIRACFVSSK